MKWIVRIALCAIGSMFIGIGSSEVTADGEAPPTTRYNETLESIEATFGMNGEWTFFAKAHAVNGAVQRTWFFSRTGVGDATEFIGVANFERRAFRFERGNASITADGYGLTCQRGPSSVQYTERRPTTLQRLRFFDGSGDLFSAVSVRDEEWVGLMCTLTTPSDGDFESDQGQYLKYREKRRGNTIF